MICSLLVPGSLLVGVSIMALRLLVARLALLLLGAITCRLRMRGALLCRFAGACPRVAGRSGRARFGGSGWSRLGRTMIALHLLTRWIRTSRCRIGLDVPEELLDSLDHLRLHHAHMVIDWHAYPVEDLDKFLAAHVERLRIFIYSDSILVVRLFAQYPSPPNGSGSLRIDAAHHSVREPLVCYRDDDPFRSPGRTTESGPVVLPT